MARFHQQVDQPVQVGGTVTGEHGVGLGKVALLEEQFGEDGVGVMRNIKTALDPRFVQTLHCKAISKIVLAEHN